MPDTKATAALRAALQFTMSHDMPSEHKAVIIDLLTKALRENASQERASLSPIEGPWEEQETQIVRTVLAGKVATSWQHADELLTDLASQLGRRPQGVRNKAIELGLGEAVDYRLAKSGEADRARQQDEIT